MTADANHELVPTGKEWRRHIGKAGSFAFGPYAVDCEFVIPAHARGDWESSFVVSTPQGATAKSVLPFVQPRTPELASGIEIRVDGEIVHLKRNGPRPFRFMRTITIMGSGLEWAVPGSALGTPPIVDAASAEPREIWTPRRGGQVDPRLAASAAAVLVGLIIGGIPQSTSIANALNLV